jgi:hypothetical protein
VHLRRKKLRPPNRNKTEDWGDEVQEAEFEEVTKEAAPKKRKTAKAKVEPKADLQDILDAWADEDD